MKIINKPWGKEEVLEINDKYMLKKLTMYAGKKCSLQYHNYKKETIYILSGKLRIYKGENENELDSEIYLKGESITLNPGQIHRMEGVEDSVYLEASTPEMDDVVRILDDYNRI
ncbi:MULTISPECIES: cupin [unclassified Prochlorococcus]|uniref:cupin n=1 Tax=unclassified Prochlorococcus TaxID=2627481 RepID=UPI00097CC78C|nr:MULTISPECIES: cupin [unclassified Prochlorococcus]AQL29797.1 cupin [Prochlorococcus sp. RS50]AQL31573.1 cupin [Prochlorococcus sp. RS01]AQL34525.1 cupin [Prochlorococcus sp. RS04]